MAQLNRDHRERHIAHGEPAGISMAQAVEIDRRIDPRCNAGRGERALFKLVEVGREIPEQFYSAVAEILAYVYELTGKMKQRRAA